MSNMPNRIFVSKKVDEKIIPNIDNSKLLGLDKYTSERTDLIMFAMALGLEKGMKKELEQKVGLILPTSVKPFPMSMIFSVLVDDLIKRNEIEKIGDQDEAFIVAQQYANVGFEEIQNLLEKDEDLLMWEMLNVLDEKYVDLFCK
jgi:hypothetical protein